MRWRGPWPPPPIAAGPGWPMPNQDARVGGEVPPLPAPEGRLPNQDARVGGEVPPLPGPDGGYQTLMRGLGEKCRPCRPRRAGGQTLRCGLGAGCRSCQTTSYFSVRRRAGARSGRGGEPCRFCSGRFRCRRKRDGVRVVGFPGRRSRKRRVGRGRVAVRRRRH